MAAGAQAGGALLSAYGSIQQGKMTSDSLNRQADSLEQQARAAQEAGQYDAMRQGIAAGRKIGGSIAAYGASGVAADSGSVAEVIRSSSQNAELDRLNILHGADVRAINYKNQAAMNRYGGESAKLGSYWKALGALTNGMVKYSESNNAATPGGAEEADMMDAGSGSGEAMAGMA